MIRFYSLFVIDEQLLESPYVRRLSLFHDAVLHQSKTESVHFLLQKTLSPEQRANLHVSYDPFCLTLHRVEIVPYSQQTLLLVKLTPKEIGTVRLGFVCPKHVKQNKQAKLATVSKM